MKAARHPFRTFHSLSSVALLFTAVAAPAFAASCDSLASKSFPDAKVTLAQEVTGGSFTPPGARNALANLPKFCRVAVTLAPSSDSDIRVELWLPLENWNGKFQGVGNGGWAGSITYGALAEALRRGYATSSTDTGHQDDVTSAKWALGHPEKVVDYAWRSEHEMTVKSKVLISAFYGQDPKYSYWTGCSGGGKQAITEAQKFPEDYDGIVAGSSAYDLVPLHAAWIRIAQVSHKTEASYIPAEKYSLVHNAILDACDAIDGAKDGLLENPTKCKFEPKSLLCKGADGPGCLTAPQVEAATEIFSPTRDSRTKKQLMWPLMPGSENAWGVLAGPLTDNAPASRESSVAINTYKYWIFKNPNWDYKTLNFDKDIDYAYKQDNGLNSANNPDLRPFLNRKGKLIMYHGWADQIVPPQHSVSYYNNVLEKVGSSARDSIHLFMVPGMEHCRGGVGPNEFDYVTALEQWVEQGKAPASMIASHRGTDGKVDRTRPICAYPTQAKYKGTGNLDDAANFSCVVP
ncbi:MAG: tannase/feruloyl esterase family alpha/beta hydrolase [Bryobacteraceae bacterium]